MVVASMLNLFSTFSSGEEEEELRRPSRQTLTTCNLTTIYQQPYPKDLANQSAIPQPTMQPTTLNLKPIDRTFSSSKRPARRPVPDARQVDPVNNVRPTWEYMASKDGRDRNLIIMLHGVGTF